jgi:hypothetical protein
VLRGKVEVHDCERTIRTARLGRRC